MNKNEYLVIYTTSIILFFLMLIVGYLVVFTIQRNSQCIENPFIYGARVMNDNVSCNCYYLDKNKQGFYFDEKGIKVTNIVFNP